MIYKLQLYAQIEDDFKYIDFYCDVTKILGFYIPEPEDDDEELSINMFLGSEIINVKQEKHITDYLFDKFVNNAIEK